MIRNQCSIWSWNGRATCATYGASVWEFDGTLIHLRASNGIGDGPAVKRAVEAIYPMLPSRERLRRARVLLPADGR